jgi:hypothetical protein
MRRRSKTCDVARKVPAKEQTPRGSRDDRLEVRPRETAGRVVVMQALDRGGSTYRVNCNSAVARETRRGRGERCDAKGASDACEGESG